MQEQKTLSRLFDIPYYQLHNCPLEKAFVTKKNNNWEHLSTQAFINHFCNLSKALLDVGFQAGNKIAIISSSNCTDWHLVDMAVQQIGAILVPIYPSISQKDYQYIFTDASIDYCFVSDQALYQKILALKPSLPQLKIIYSFDNSAPDTLEQLLEKGKNIVDDGTLEKLHSKIQTTDLVTIIYTSGTTGTPKGVMLTHENILSNVLACREILNFKVERALSFLPICHILERMILYYFQSKGIGIYFAESIEKISDNIKEVKPQIMSVVPRLLEKVFDKIISKGQELTGFKYKLFFWAVAIGEQYHPFQSQNFWYKFKLKIARKLIFNKWNEALGGELKVVISGSASLQERLIKIFWAAGIPVIEGYGLTETSPVIGVNGLTKDLFELGTVGKPLKNLDVKINEEGEILVKGPSVTKGYFQAPEKTTESFTSDGYFCTGDIGFITPRGFIKITDRKKEIFKTSGGKYIAPQPIEIQLKSSRFIEQAMVIGADEKMPCAFIQLDYAFIKTYANHKQLQLDTSNYEIICQNDTIKKRIEIEINKINEGLGNWEKIKQFKLIPTQWSIEGGELTPTMKLKRKAIIEKYQKYYDELYKS